MDSFEYIPDISNDLFLLNRAMFKPSTIASSLYSNLSSFQSQETIEAVTHFRRHSEIMSRHYVLEAFTNLGWRPSKNEATTTNELMWGLGIRERYRKLVERLLEMIAVRNGEYWRVKLELKQKDQIADIEESDDKLSPLFLEMTLLNRCGSQLAEVLTGGVDPLDLLFPASGIGAEEIYYQSPVARIYNALLAKAAANVISKVPRDRALRVLEVGAGTGGATSTLLAIFETRKTQYYFTDVSETFISNGKRKFRSYNFLTYQSLDIEKDPQEQGIVSNSFDIVVAANVLHATSDLNQSLKHVKKLLASNGLLIMLELTDKSAWIDLTFGLLAGWWKFEDEVRTQYPLISEDKWKQLLCSQGFNDVQCVIPHKVFGQALVLAQGPGNACAQNESALSS